MLVVDHPMSNADGIALASSGPDRHHVIIATSGDSDPDVVGQMSMPKYARKTLRKPELPPNFLCVSAPAAAHPGGHVEHTQ